MSGVARQSGVLREVRTLFGLGLVRGGSDGQLLEQFLGPDEAAAEAAFTILVERHGPMVLQVCRQVLDDPDDAHDAFQATFLVLLRRARSIRKRESVASWLFGVARRVARRARCAAVVRRFHERQGGTLAAERARDAGSSAECLAALHEEIARLPGRFREPIVLCHLEGLSTAAAADRLGCAQGTILSRLARARDRLGKRLAGRGLSVPAGFLAAGKLPPVTASAAPAYLAARTAADRAALLATVPPTAAALAHSTLRSLLMTRLTLAVAVLATAAAVASSTIPIVRPIRGAGPPAAFHGEGPQQSESTPDRAVLRRRHELDLLQGTWYRISSEVDGQKVPLMINGQPIPAKSPELMIVLKGDGWYGVGRDGKTLEKHHVIKLDPTRRPRAIDLYNLDSNGKPSDHASIPGIYEFSPEGDILTLCLNIGGGPEDRPKEFRTRPGHGGPWLDVYRRDKTPEEKPSPNNPNKPAEPSQQASAAARGSQSAPQGSRAVSREADQADAILPALPAGHVLIDTESDQKLTLAASPDGKTLATAGFRGVIHLWDAANGNEIGTLEGGKSTIRSVTFAPDGKTVACVNDERDVKLWDVASGALKRTFPGLAELKAQAARRYKQGTLDLPGTMMDAIAFTPDSSLIAVSGHGPIDVELPDRTYELRVFDPGAGRLRWSHVGRGEEASSLLFSPDGRMLARGGWKSVKLWDAGAGEPIRTLSPTRGTVFAIAFAPDGRTLVGGGGVPRGGNQMSAGMVTIWDVATGQILHTLEGTTNTVHAVAVAPDGKTIAAGGGGPIRRFPGSERVVSEVRLWDIATGRLLSTVEGDLDTVRGLVFKPDGRSIVYGDAASIGRIELGTPRSPAR